MEYIANGLAAGVGRTDVTPSAGTMLEGYHRPAPLSGVLDPLEICSLPSETRVQ